MKKILSILIFSLFVAILPLQLVNALEVDNAQKAQLSAQIKEIKQAIKQKTSTIKALESDIDKRGNQLSDLFQILFDRNVVPSEEKIAHIQSQEMEMAKIIKRLVKTENKIEKAKKEANANIKQEDLTTAIQNLERQSSLLDTKIELLRKYDLILQHYIDLVKSLQYK